MKRLALLLILLIFFASGFARAQCPGGNCPSAFSRDPSSLAPRLSPLSNQPTPAWRYVAPTGQYRAVVRVRGEESLGRHKLGSGVAVRWAEKTVVLTAAHVARNCKRVLVYLTRPERWAAAAVKLDDRWDVAILALSAADAAELSPADVAWGDEATPKQGARLESCGLGPDGRLAVNSGVLLGYRSNGPGRYADWIDISGPARQGDSGGPVFDAKGQVVGILWGTDDRTVTATQGGYLHKLLAESLGPWKVESRESRDESVLASGATTPGSGLSTLDSPTCLAGKLFPRLSQPKTPTPPPPQVIVNTDPAVRDSLGKIEGTLGQVAQNTAPKPEPQPVEGVPAWAKILCIAGALAVGAFVFYVVQQN